MAKYDVKYNPSKTPITGATQVGNLAVAIGSVDYTTGGYRYNNIFRREKN
jgi:hypothetical protein